MNLIKGVFGVCALSCWLAPALPASAEVLLRAAIVQVEHERPIPLSRLDLPAGDEGFAGGQRALKDNITTGQFLNQKYELVEIRTNADGLPAEMDKLAADGIGVVIAMANADDLLAMADHPAAANMLILNAEARDDRLRGEACRANVIHVAPSRAQIADGLAQYMVWKKWTEWLLIHGSHPEDELMAQAYRRAASKFGIEIVEERLFEDTGGGRQSDSGHVLVQKQIPVFMQRADDHDVVVVADENEVFGHYLPYRGWDARPVVGDAGLIASSWHKGHESYGSTQLQRRFEKLAGRHMRDLDYQVWLGLRSVGEAVTRTNSADIPTLKDFMLSDEFTIAGFKGQGLSFRPWNQQMRHGIILGDGKLVVTISPQEEFLHQKTRLDTLGFDEPENTCAF
ncbi:MAG: ABC transporter substrate-binding protein [Pseudomonadota bacterium]